MDKPGNVTNNNNIVEYNTMKDGTLDDVKAQYDEVTVLFDLTAELLDTVEDPSVIDPVEQLELVDMLADQISESTDLLCDQFLAIAEKGGKSGKLQKGRVEGALRKIFTALDFYREQMQRKGADAVNIADAVVEKITRQVERVVVIFLNYVKLSLDRIMHKTQIDEFRQHHEHIALMMHDAGLKAS